VLQRGESLALAADQGAERLLLVAVADHVQAARLAGVDLDADLEAQVSHELLEDGLAGGERLGRRLGSLELGAFGGKRPTGRRHLGLLGCGQAGGTTIRARAGGVGARAAVAIPATRAVVPAGALVTAWALVTAGALVTAWCVVPAGATVGSAVVAARAALETPVVAARAVVTTRPPVGPPVRAAVVAAGCPLTVVQLAARRGQRRGCRGVALGGGAAQGGTRRGNDPGRLGTHAENAAAAGRQNLEVQVVELRAEGLARLAQRLLDGLAGELPVGTHVSVFSLVGSGVRALPGGSSGLPRMSWRHR
jgi:hypothetical protein